jgi:hypothetical protein
MGLFGWLGDFFGSSAGSSVTTSTGGFLGASGLDDGCSINPASGLPMVSGCSGLDVAGNPYGTDFSQSDSGISNSTFGSSFDSWID